jgi:hypothetical protein
MRGNIALVSLLTAGLLVGAGQATGHQGGATAARGLPQEVDGGVIVDLADGDRFKVTVARNLKTVWGSRYDAATRSWAARIVVLRKPNVFCGGVNARAAGTAVAVIALCDKGGYSEDQAPTHSQALYSPDTVSWQSHTLPGEAYDEPGISPSGNAAVWPMYQQWVTWTSAGFRSVRHDLPGQEYTVTGTISDAGDVSVLYGASSGRPRDCVLHVLTVPAGAAETRQELAATNACSDIDLANVDALTVHFGDASSPQSLTTVSRPDTSSPWAITGIAPETAPGLVRHHGRGTAATLFASSPGLPLLAVGSADRQHFTAQAYDPVAQRWAEPRPIGDGTARCTWGDNFIDQPLGVFALRLRCGEHRRLLASPDAVEWHDVALGHSPLGVSPDGRYVAVSNRSRTLILSRERGLLRLPLPTRARCDVIQPVSPDTAVRLTTTNERGWPGRLDVSTATGWQPTRVALPRLRVGTDRCVSVDTDLYERPVSYFFTGRVRAVVLAVTPSGDGWKVRRTVY